MHEEALLFEEISFDEEEFHLALRNLIGNHIWSQGIDIYH